MKTMKLLALFVALSLIVCAVSGCSSAKRMAEKESTNIETEFAGIPDPEDIGSSGEFIESYKKYSDLYVRITNLYADNLDNSRVKEVYDKIITDSRVWDENSKIFTESFEDTEEGNQKAHEFVRDLYKCSSAELKASTYLREKKKSAKSDE